MRLSPVSRRLWLTTSSARQVGDPAVHVNYVLMRIHFLCSGSEVVVEELLTGPEVSVLAFSDGYTIVPLPAAQDHKRIGEGDTGPNTGGMGAYAPAPVATPAVMDRISKEVLQPTISGMRREGT